MFTITNYWWLIIWILTAGIAMNLFIPKRIEFQNGEAEERWQPFWAFILVLPYILWAGFRNDSFGDTGAYRAGIKNIPSTFSGLPKYISGMDKDRGFYAFEAVLKVFFKDHPEYVFLVIAAIQMIILVAIYRKYSCDLWFSIFVFVASTDYLSWMFNGIRQFLAVTVILLATPFILKRKYIPAVLIVLLASTLHQSALLMLPVIFLIQGKAWNRRSVTFIIVSIAILFYANQFTHFLDSMLSNTQYKNVVSDWQEWKDNGTNPIRILVYSVPVILSVIGIRYIREADDPVINLSVNAGLIATGLGIVSTVTSGIFIGRLPIYCSLYSTGILLPWEIDHMFTEDSRRLVKLVAVVLYLLFFYYQMHIAWGVF